MFVRSVTEVMLLFVLIFTMVVSFWLVVFYGGLDGVVVLSWACGLFVIVLPRFVVSCWTIFSTLSFSSSKALYFIQWLPFQELCSGHFKHLPENNKNPLAQDATPFLSTVSGWSMCS